MITSQQEHIIKSVIQKINPSFVGVFGSYARGDNSSNSDLDILIDFNSKVDLLDLIGLEQELSETLGVKVDLVTKRSLTDSLRPYIESDLIQLL